MTTRVSRWLPAAVALAVGLAGCASSVSPPGASMQSPAVKRPAPDIVGTDQDGKQLKLSDYRGKVVLLDFWFST
jgi:cytochrome oxidase Cu insertion factor (SCO1/SenC/PrrC family)